MQCSFSLATSSSSTSSDETVDQLDIEMNVIEWIATLEHGFVNDKQGLMKDEEGRLKVVATKPIGKGEMLLQVPWEVMITGEVEDDADLNCHLVHNLARELFEEQPNPYTNYLKTRKRHGIPSDFSDLGKEMLVDILSYSSELPPEDPFSWLEDDWYGHCQGDPSNDKLKQASMLAVQYSYNGVMVPVYDMYRHRNGPKYYNTFVVWDPESKGMVLAALREIEEGEELYQSINQCYNCDQETYQFYGASGELCTGVVESL